MSKETEIQDEFDDRYKFSDTGWRGFNTEARTDMEMFLNAQFSEEEYKKAELVGRSLYVINKLARQIDLLHGYEIRNRHILKITPIGGEDNEIARQHTAAITQQMSMFCGYDVMSMCFKYGQLVSGSNLMEIYRDRNGFFRYARLGYNQFLLDPTLTKTTLEDCQYYLTGRWVSDATAKALLPEGADKIKNISAGSGPSRWDFSNNFTHGFRNKLRLYEEYWKRVTSFVPTVISRLTGEQIPFKEVVKRFKGDARRVNYLIENTKMPDGQPALSKFDKPMHRVELTVFVDDVPVYMGDNPLRTGFNPNAGTFDDYNVVWFHGGWAHEMDNDALKLQSFIRRNRDPQLARQRRINQAIDIIEAQLTAWRLAKEGALKNAEDAYTSGQGKVLWVDKNFDGNLDEAFKQGQTPDIPPGMFNLLNTLDKDLTEVGGLNEEIFGSDTKDIPAVLSRQRTGAALTGHANIFQEFRAAKQLFGRKQMRLNQLHLDPIRVQRMINEPPTEGFYAPDAANYDCLPTEGLLTANQRESNYLELKEMRTLWPDMATIITPSDILETAPIQASSQIMARIKQREQQQAQAAQQAQQDQARMNRLVEAETAAKIAKAKEDTSDVVENRANIQLLNARTAGEIENLKNEQLLEGAMQIAKLELVQAQTKAALAQAEAAKRGTNNASQRRSKQKNRKR